MAQFEQALDEAKQKKLLAAIEKGDLGAFNQALLGKKAPGFMDYVASTGEFTMAQEVFQNLFQERLKSAQAKSQIQPPTTFGEASQQIPLGMSSLGIQPPEVPLIPQGGMPTSTGRPMFGEQELANLLSGALAKQMPGAPAVAPGEMVPDFSAPLTPVQQAQLMQFAGAVPQQAAEQVVKPPSAPKIVEVGGVPYTQLPTGAITPTPGFVTPAAKPSPKLEEVKSFMSELGIDPNSQEGKGYLKNYLEKTTAKQESPSTTIINQMGGGIAKEIITEARNSAEGALNTHDAVLRASDAIAKQAVTLGPTATVRNTIDQVAQVMGVAGKDTQERLVNTRNVIRSLAQFSLAARKQLKGQGQVSDFEGKLIVKAESGEIDDMTLPELKSFLGVTDRLAKRQYDNYQRQLKVMKNKKELKDVADFFEVPEWTTSKKSSSGVVDFKDLPK